MIKGNAFAFLSLPNLKTVTKGIIISGTSVLLSISLPNLKTGSMDIRNNDALTSIELLKLTTAHDTEIYNNPVLTGISLPGLKTAGKITIRDNARLSSVFIPKLEKAEEIKITNTDYLGSSVKQDYRNALTVCNLGKYSKEAHCEHRLQAAKEEKKEQEMLEKCENNNSEFCKEIRAAYLRK